MNANARPLDVSIVIPCLNEESSIRACVDEALKAIANAGVTGEVVVVDNNSTDRSAALAAAAGARVVAELRPGYGSAYIAGLGAAKGRTILMGDGDGTYDFGELPRFLDMVTAGADVVLGSRLRGTIHHGAMPWHHRWIGNPALTGMLNVLFGAGVSDAHCGLRMIKADAVPLLHLRTPGMEFASEMVVKAAQAGLRIAETPIEYRARPSKSASKLKAVRDGLRHVRYMLAWARPSLFWIPATVLTLIGALSLTPLYTLPGAPVTVAGFLVAGGLLAHLGGWLRAYRALVLDPQPAEHRVARWMMARSSIVSLAVAVACLAAAGLLRPHGETAEPAERVVWVIGATVCVALAAGLGMARLNRIAPRGDS